MVVLPDPVGPMTRVDERAGKVTYHAITTFKDGTSSDGGDQTLTGSTLLLGEDTATLTVTVIPDLLDWNVVKLATIELHYTDTAHGVDERESFTFRKRAPEGKWELGLRDRNRKSYSWTAKFFMQDGSKRDSKSPGEVPDESLILELPPGKTTTYGDIARRLGDVALSQQVGQALGRNPIPVIVPCHRVLGANGWSGGFSAPGGVRTKERLLLIEGVDIRPPPDLFDER